MPNLFGGIIVIGELAGELICKISQPTETN